MFEGSPEREWKDHEKRLNKMVFIGKDLDMDLLKEGFEDCLHEEEALVTN
jgi:G3E family GTPase